MTGAKVESTSDQMAARNKTREKTTNNKQTHSADSTRVAGLDSAADFDARVLAAWLVDGATAEEIARREGIDEVTMLLHLSRILRERQMAVLSGGK